VHVIYGNVRLMVRLMVTLISNCGWNVSTECYHWQCSLLEICVVNVRV